MIPLKDDAPRITTPYVTYVLLVVNTVIFLLEVGLQQGYHGEQQLSLLMGKFGVVPARFSVVLFNGGYVPWNLISALHARYVNNTEVILSTC
jgi:membrane associated rhomboid family serine protease